MQRERGVEMASTLMGIYRWMEELPASRSQSNSPRITLSEPFFIRAAKSSHFGL